MFFHSAGGQLPQIKVSAELCPPEGSWEGSFLASSSSWWYQASLACVHIAPFSASIFTQPAPRGVFSYKDFCHQI